jgi:hypothetical protein
MEGIPLKRQILLSRDIMSAWNAIENGVVDQTTKRREKYWAHWCEYTAAFNHEPYLRQANNMQKNIIITAFAARVRSGHYGQKHRVTVQTVANALSSISKTIELAGEQSPVYETQGTYKLPVARLVEGFRREDPPPVAQLAVPIAVPETCFDIGYATNTNTSKAIGDLALIAFFYLLRVGEYTKPRTIIRNNKRIRATRTIQFHIKDVGFFKNNKVLPRNSPLEILLQADSATLKITNQKNGRMGQTIHHESFDTKYSPVKALARRVHHVLSNGGNNDNLICDVATKPNEWIQITPINMLQAIRGAGQALNLKNSGIDPDLIGVHSLRAGGAMALKLSGEADTTIKKMGRWSSLTFLEYIHNQIAHLSHNLATKMSAKISFTNIAAIES